MYKITDVQITPIKPKDGLLGFASVVFNGSFYLGSIGIMTRPEGGYRIAYPTRKISKGSFNIFHPINRDIARAMENAIIEKFEQVTKSDKPDSWAYKFVFEG